MTRSGDANQMTNSSWPNSFQTSRFIPAVEYVPQALMVTGRLYDDATVLRVALAYERATKWHTMNPSLDEGLRKTTQVG